MINAIINKNTYNNIIYFMGSYSPFIFFLSSLYILFNTKITLWVFIFGFIINIFINIILKLILQIPRPSENINHFNMEHNNLYFERFIQNFDRFGMPSGHAQIALFTSFFMYLIMNKSNNPNLYYYLFYYFGLILITLYQRVKYNYHTILQVIIGSIIGIFISFIFYNYNNKLISGELKAKKDDFYFN